MIIYLDAHLVINPNNTLLEPKFTIRRKNENREPSIGFSGDIVFTGVDYDYIYNKLVVEPNAINDFIILKFVDNCCNDKEYIFQIKPESLQWCENSCEINANALEFTEDSKLYACASSTLVWDNWNNFNQQNHPRIPYCLEFRPSVMHDAMIILSILTFSGLSVLIPLVATIIPLVATINLIITAVNTLPSVNISPITIGGFSNPIQILQWGLNQLNQFGAYIVGCNFDHPSPLVRSYINNACQKCGIAFSSSILNDPNNDYWNLAYFSAPIRKGQSQGDYFGGLVNLIDNNKPIRTLKTFLDEVAEVFNAEWDIHNGVLRFERKDFFNQQTPWLDLITYDSRLIKSVCYEWTRKTRYALADIKYQKDALDWVGSEAIQRWSDIIEWNNPVNTLQKGILEKTFPFGAARFRDDKLDRDVLADYSWAPFGFGSAIMANDSVMIMNNGTAFLPKLLILEDNFNWQKARIKSNYTVSGYNAVNHAYNYPMWVDANLTGNLYDRFWQIEDPRNTSFKGFDVTIKIEWTCKALNDVNIDGTVLTNQGLAKVDSIDLDFSNNTMIIKGTL